MIMLQAWTHQPGTLIALEALIRGCDSIRHFDKACVVVNQAVNAIEAASSSPHPGMLPACLSLAGTLRKLLHSHTYANRTRSKETTAHPATAEDVRASTVSYANTAVLMTVLLNTITALDCQTQLYAPDSPGWGIFRDSSGDPVINNKHSRAGRSPEAVSRLNADMLGIAGEGSQIDSKGRVAYKFASKRAVLVYQLQTILLTCLTTLCHMHIEAGPDDPRVWLAPVSQGIGKLKSRLAEVGTLLLSERVFSTGAAETYVSICMERFGVVAFSGRLLPGCCNIGCRNLEGLSEAALPTWLCGSCKRSRYCSQDCQKMAFGRGHSNFCQAYHGVIGSMV